MRNSVKVLLKAALPAPATVVPGHVTTARIIDDHSYRKHVTDLARPAWSSAASEGMRWSATGEQQALM